MGPFGMSGANLGTVGARPGMGITNNPAGSGWPAGTGGPSGYGYGYTSGGPGYGNPGYAGGTYGAGVYGPASGRYGYGYPNTGGAAMAYAYWASPRFWGSCGYPYYGGGYGMGYGYPYFGGYAMGYGYGGYGYPSTTMATAAPRAVSGYSSAYVPPGMGTSNGVASGHYLGIDEEPMVDTGGVRGMKIAKVYPGTAAEKAGLQVGDVLHSVNGYLTQQRGNLAWIIASAAPDNVLKMNVRTIGDGQEHTITARIP
jgi:hypothetical protein